VGKSPTINDVTHESARAVAWRNVPLSVHDFADESAFETQVDAAEHGWYFAQKRA
jgi:hypothetical protein